MDHKEALKVLQTLINVASKAEPCVAHRIFPEMVGVINNLEPPKGPDLEALKRPSHLTSLHDIQMLGSMDGLNLARFVRDRSPPINIVATSGRVIVCDDDLPDGIVVLPKPHCRAEVVATLREMTGAA